MIGIATGIAKYLQVTVAECSWLYRINYNKDLTKQIILSHPFSGVHSLKGGGLEKTTLQKIFLGMIQYHETLYSDSGFIFTCSPDYVQ